MHRHVHSSYKHTQNMHAQYACMHTHFRRPHPGPGTQGPSSPQTGQGLWGLPAAVGGRGWLWTLPAGRPRCGCGGDSSLRARVWMWFPGRTHQCVLLSHPCSECAYMLHLCVALTRPVHTLPRCPNMARPGPVPAGGQRLGAPGLSLCAVQTHHGAGAASPPRAGIWVLVPRRVLTPGPPHPAVPWAPSLPTGWHFPSCLLFFLPVMSTSTTVFPDRRKYQP